MPVQVFDLSKCEANLVDQHAKCVICKGAKTSGMWMIKCNDFKCAKHYHADCIPSIDLEEIKKQQSWFCSENCGKLGAVPKVTEINSDEKLKALELKFQLLMDQNCLLEDKLSKLSQASEIIVKEKARLEDELQKKIANESLHQFNDLSAMNSTHTHPVFNAQLNPNAERVNRILQQAAQMRTLQETINPSVEPENVVTSALNSLQANSTADSAAYLNALRERRKHLPVLPSFDGRGSEWLLFKNTYETIKTQGQFSYSEMSTKLRLALKGKAYEYARNQLSLAHPNPEKILVDLGKKFFKPREVISEAYIAVERLPAITEEDPEQLDGLKRAAEHFIAICTDLKDAVLLFHRIPEPIEDKLPKELSKQWLRDIRREHNKGNWHDLVRFLDEACEDLKVPLETRLKIAAKENSRKSSELKTSSVANVHSILSQDKESSSSSASSARFVGELTPCDYDNCNRAIFRCTNFTDRSHEVKLKFLRAKNYCLLCLRKGHSHMPCPNAPILPRCREEGCPDPFGHVSVMHPPAGFVAESNVNLVSSQTSNMDNQSFFQVASAVVQDANGKDVPVTIFFDSGSNATLISNDLFMRLGLKGQPHSLAVNWCAGNTSHRSQSSFKTELSVASAEQPLDRFVLKNVITLENLKLPLQEQNEKKLHQLFPHLASIKIPEFALQRPQILLGLQHREFMLPSHIIYPPSSSSSAIAEKTKLGWVISCVNYPEIKINQISSECSKLTGSSNLEDSEEVLSFQHLSELVKKLLDNSLTTLSRISSIEQKLEVKSSREINSSFVCESDASSPFVSPSNGTEVTVNVFELDNDDRIIPVVAERSPFNRESTLSEAAVDLQLSPCGYGHRRKTYRSMELKLFSNCKNLSSLRGGECYLT